MKIEVTIHRQDVNRIVEIEGFKSIFRLFISYLYKVGNSFPHCGDSVGSKCGKVIIVYEKCPLLCALLKVSRSSFFHHRRLS